MASASLSALKEEVTCPVCLEVPRRGGLFQCPNGHLICEDDHAKLKGAKTCPECRASYGQGKPMRNKLAEKLLNVIEVPCR